MGKILAICLMLTPGLARAQVSREGAEAIKKTCETVFEENFKEGDKTLDVELWWDREEVNATFEKWNGRLRVILFEGLLKRPGFDEDALAAVTCHELGHMMGGSPIWNVSSVETATNEGQSDYWAARECLPRVLKRIAASGAVSTKTTAKTCRSAKDAALCERVAMAGYKMIRTFKAVDNDDSPLSFETRDKKDARKGAIINIHPSYQCRIDTFLAGASGASRPKCWYNP